MNIRPLYPQAQVKRFSPWALLPLGIVVFILSNLATL
jgi:hypothetical protein